MPTKVIVLGEPEWKPTGTKRIGFVKYLDTSYELDIAGASPKDYETIILISRDYGDAGYDVMKAVDTGDEPGAIYLGYFNDGVVEP